MKIPLLLALAATCLALHSTPVNAASVRDEVVFLQSIPPHATLAQIKRLLPAGVRLSTPKMQPVGGDGMAWVNMPISGRFKGEMVFANSRPHTLIKRLPEDWERIPKYRKQVLSVGQVRAGDPIQGITLFTSTRASGAGASGIDAVTKESIESLRPFLGKPTKTAYYHYDPNNDDPEGYHGHYAEWRRANGGTIWTTMETRGEKTDGYPEIGLRFAYSRFYQP